MGSLELWSVAAVPVHGEWGTQLLSALLLVQVEHEGLLAVEEEVYCTREMLGYLLVLLPGVQERIPLGR